MQQVGIWHIDDTGPKKAERSSIDLERQLEDWIERDPSLLESGLTFLGRQIPLEAGPLDLLRLLNGAGPVCFCPLFRPFLSR